MVSQLVRFLMGVSWIKRRGDVAHNLDFLLKESLGIRYRLLKPVGWVGFLRITNCSIILLGRMENVTFRLTTYEDASYTFCCETETMREYAIATWGEWPEERIRAHAFENAYAGRTEIIELNGKPIGIFRVERSAASYDLKQIFVLPRHQRRGIGSALARHSFKRHQPRDFP